MQRDDLLLEIRAALRAGAAQDATGTTRDLTSFERELLADSSNQRAHDLFFDLDAHELRVLPCAAAKREPSLLLLPLHGAADGLVGADALAECVDLLQQQLSVPVLARRIHPDFFNALDVVTGDTTTALDSSCGGASP